MDTTSKTVLGIALVVLLAFTFTPAAALTILLYTILGIGLVIAIAFAVRYGAYYSFLAFHSLSDWWERRRDAPLIILDLRREFKRHPDEEPTAHVHVCPGCKGTCEHASADCAQGLQLECEACFDYRNRRR